MRKLLSHNVSGITIIAMGALVMFLATKVTDVGRPLLVFIGNFLFILGVLVLVFHEKLDTNMWRGRVDLFARVLTYFTLFIFAVIVWAVAMWL